MTDSIPIDALALPTELARQPRLDLNDWMLREVSLEHHYLASPQLNAVLLPLNVRAIRQFNTIWGQCFLAMGHLWRIVSCELQIDAAGLGSAEIICQSIWQQPSESRRVESRPALPG